MILFHSKLYVASELAAEQRKVIKKLKQGKLQIGVYVIAIPVGEQDMLEIYPSYVLLQEAYKQMDVQVVGLAGSQSSAYEILEMMTNDCIQATGSVNIREYFSR